jgi:preprotein translocase subunit SecA
MNDQRKVIFDQRIGIMKGDEVAETVDDMRNEVIDDLISKHIPANAYPEQWDMAGLRERLRDVVAVDFPLDEWGKEEGIADEEIRERVKKIAGDFYHQKRTDYGTDVMHQVEKAVLLQTLDNLWREHIITVDMLRQVIHLRGYGQRDPLNEYKTEGFNLFQAMVTKLRENSTAQLMRVEVRAQPEGDMLPEEGDLPPMAAHHFDASTGEDDVVDAVFGQHSLGAPLVAPARDPKKPESWGQVGRNEPCPCGSGKKYKHCHGAYS